MATLANRYINLTHIILKAAMLTTLSPLPATYII